jgi:hypothetical protein
MTVIVRRIERVGRYRRVRWRLVLVSVAAFALLAVPHSGDATTRLGTLRGRGDLRRARERRRRQAVDATPGPWKRLTRRLGDDWAPDFSPDGTRIAFTQLLGTVWVLNADGTGLRALTRGTDADWRPL